MILFKQKSELSSPSEKYFFFHSQINILVAIQNIGLFKNQTNRFLSQTLRSLAQNFDLIYILDSHSF